MNEVQNNLANIKMSCVIEAGKLKQNPTTSEEYKDKSVVDIAKELEKFVLSN